MVQATSSIGIQKGSLSSRAGVTRERVMEGVGLELGVNEGRTWGTGRISKTNNRGKWQKYQDRSECRQLLRGKE